MNLSAVLLLAIGISLDGFVAGTAYGLRRVRIPLTSVVITSLVSGVAVLMGMAAGALVGQYIDTGFVPRLGAVLLIGLGFWSMIQGQHKVEPTVIPDGIPSREEDMILRVQLQPFGLVIQVWKEPLTADLDCSGTIGGWEAVLLGVALALDAMGVGLAAALAGFPLVATCGSVIMVSFLALSGGLMIGCRWASKAKMPRRLLTLLPGGVLVVIGSWWLITAGR